MACEGFNWANPATAVTNWYAAFDGTSAPLVLIMNHDEDSGDLVAEGFEITPTVTYDEIADSSITFLAVPPGIYTFTAFSAMGCSFTGTVILGDSFGGLFGIWSRAGIAYSELDATTDPTLTRTLRPGFPPAHPVLTLEPDLAQGTVPTIDLRASMYAGGAKFDIAAFCRARLVATRAHGGESGGLPTNRLWAARLIPNQSTAYLLDSAMTENQLSSYLPNPNGWLLTPFKDTLPSWGTDWLYTVLYLQHASTEETRLLTMESTTVGAGSTFTATPFVGYADSVYTPTVLPCPRYPVPVYWLGPEGGLGFWVFDGYHTLGIATGAPDTYTDAQSIERVLRRDAVEVITLESGTVPSLPLYEALRTILHASAVWVWRGESYAEDDGAWLPAVVDGNDGSSYRANSKWWDLSVRLRLATAIPTQGS